MRRCFYEGDSSNSPKPKTNITAERSEPQIFNFSNGQKSQSKLTTISDRNLIIKSIRRRINTNQCVVTGIMESPSRKAMAYQDEADFLQTLSYPILPIGTDPKERFRIRFK